MYIILKTNYYHSKDGITTLATKNYYNSIDEAKEHLDSIYQKDSDYRRSEWREENYIFVDFDGAGVKFEIKGFTKYEP